MDKELSKIEVMPTLDYVSDVRNILSQARSYVKKSVNNAMIHAYWLIGQRIVMQEQNGDGRAEYGKAILKELSVKLTEEFGSGFSVQSLYNFRQFFLRFPEPEKFSTMWRILTWSHYKVAMRVVSDKARTWYCDEAAKQVWDVRTLDRNISTQYYERLLASQQKQPVIQEMEEKTKEFQDEKLEFIKNPYVLEFLGLPANMTYKEKQLEQAIINSLQKFLLELGKGFAFVDRQKLIRSETQDFYIDLVFYNILLKCYVLIDLKIGKLTHQDVGQMDMYVRMFDDLHKNHDDNPTIGILLCSETDKTIAKYSVLNESKQIFASKYLTLLPSEEDLAKEIAHQREIFNEIHDNE